MRPIIFLDVDGVLNTPLSWGYRREKGMDREKVERVSKLAEEVNADVIISSAWRNAYSLLELKDMLQKRGFQNTARIIGITPRISLERRGEEIKAWINETLIGVKPKFVALDDQWEISFLAHGVPYVQTRCSVGITDADVENAKLILRPDADAISE